MRGSLKRTAAVVIINSQFVQRCRYLGSCCWGSKGGVCQNLQSGEGFDCLFSQPLQSWALCGSSIRTPRELDLHVSFTRYCLFFALFCPETSCILFCGTSESCCVWVSRPSWEDRPAAVMCNPACRSGQTWYLDVWQQLVFYCALVR